MRIVLVNWAPIWEGAGSGGGVNGYCQSLALALRERGHEVVSLFGGLIYVRRPRGPFIRRHEDWLGVRVFEVINSPVLAPSIAQFKDPMGEVSQPELEKAVGGLLGTLRPDVVHWHNLEGFSAGCVAAAGACGARVIFSLHNYHPLCPQVTLARDHKWACHDFECGHACARCVAARDPADERRRREADHHARSPDHLAAAAAALRAEWGSFKHELSWPKRLLVKGARVGRAWAELRRRSREPLEPYLPGLPASTPAEVRHPLPPRGPEGRGQAAAILARRRHAVGGPPQQQRDPRDHPVLNVIQPERGDRPLNDYGRRRRALVEMLASCHRVLAVSRFVADKYAAAGVPRDRLSTLAIGTRINEIVRAGGGPVPPPPLRRTAGGLSRPVRLVFLGYNHFNKGLPLLADALGRLSPEHLGAIDLAVYALGGETIEPRFRLLEPRLARLIMRHGFAFDDVPALLAGRDLSLVLSTWWDPAPQTVFESFACGVPVLGADLGGIPDFVEPGVNGLLFRGNDAADLVRRLAGVIDEPEMLHRLREGVRPPKDIAAHAAELEAVYREEPAAGGRPAPGPNGRGQDAHPDSLSPVSSHQS